ncbi:MAG: type II toxin-antitoxin system RelE/ParE family toxin [Cyanobacterium sp. T60_A2020_053]|nr:type II toxin-antitoxin system RelE/ParE family toxin [Cyanobacterium sp. T60_A2020_053]
MANNTFSMRFANEFENNLYKLSKKYHNIKADIKPIIEQLQKGNILGDRISGFSPDIYVYKVRVKNSNIQKGKSGGYRLIYFWESETSILLLTIYSKSQQEDISINQINAILDEFNEN